MPRIFGCEHSYTLVHFSLKKLGESKIPYPDVHVLSDD